MKDLREKIIALRLFRILFNFIFLAGALLFVLFNIFESHYFIRNAAISLVLMAFGYALSEFYGFKIKEYLSEYKSLKSNKLTKKSVVIEFDKIA